MPDRCAAPSVGAPPSVWTSPRWLQKNAHHPPPAAELMRQKTIKKVLQKTDFADGAPPTRMPAPSARDSPLRLVAAAASFSASNLLLTLCSVFRCGEVARESNAAANLRRIGTVVVCSSSCWLLIRSSLGDQSPSARVHPLAIL